MACCSVTCSEEFPGYDDTDGRKTAEDDSKVSCDSFWPTTIDERGIFPENEHTLPIGLTGEDSIGPKRLPVVVFLGW